MPNYSGVWSLSQQFQGRGQGLWPNVPGTPTIGTASLGAAGSVSVAFTPPSCTGAPGPVTYTATSTPGSITATGASSPIVVTGLTSGTAYTFKVKGNNGTGSSPCSAASNSVTPVITCATYTTAGDYTFVVPAGVTAVTALAVGGGGRGGTAFTSCEYCCCCGGFITYYLSGGGGAGGSLAYRNSYSVTPGQSYTVRVAPGGFIASSMFLTSTPANIVVRAGSGGNASGQNAGNPCSSYTGTLGYGGQQGGGGAVGYSYRGGGGGGGAGGYAGNGGSGGGANSVGVSSGGGGGGGGGGASCGSGLNPGNGGGVGLYGRGACGQGGALNTSGTAGSGGSGVLYGGGGRGGTSGAGLNGGVGAIRIIWAGGARGTPAFPSTCVGP